MTPTACWINSKLSAKRDAFRNAYVVDVSQRLLTIRDIRTDVMHFNPDPLGPNQKRELDQMKDFLR